MNPVKHCSAIALVLLFAVPLSGQNPQAVPGADVIKEQTETSSSFTPQTPVGSDLGFTAETSPRMPAIPAPAAGAHRGAVTALLAAADSALIYSVGEDGFLDIWDCNAGKAIERFQISPYNISQMAFRPFAAAGEQKLSCDLAIAENGSNTYRVSVWDIDLRTKRFSVNLKDPVSFLSWSAAGSFLMAATSGKAGICFLDSETGAFLDTAPEIADRIIFAGTGKSEKSMLTYSPAGFLSYWDFDSGEEIRRYPAPRNLSSVLLFGAKRFFAGIGAEGLSVYDAVSGTLLARDKSAAGGKLASADPESADFYLMQSDVVIHYYLTSRGQLEALKKIILPQTAGSVNSFFPLKDGRIILGGTAGILTALSPGGGIKTFRTENQTRITEAAVSGSMIAFLAEDRGGKTIGIIPLDYRELRNIQNLPLTVNMETYTRITPANPPGLSGTSRFILWQPDTFQKFPAMWTGAYSGTTLTFTRTAAFLNLPLQANLRAVSVYRNRALFLTMRGALMAVSLEADTQGRPPDGTPLFDHQTIGAAAAAYLDDRTIILGRNTLNNPPFLTMSPETGTSSLLPDLARTGLAAGIRLYPGTSRLYGVTTSRTRDGFFTRVVSIGEREAAQSVLFEYAGEDQNLSVAELSGAAAPAVIAANPGGEEVVLLPAGTAFERAPGFPFQVLGGVSSFIVLDTEGNFSWIDPATGRIQARFALYGGRWLLVERNGAVWEGGIIR
jgi:WD40 repeat protein